MKLRELLNENLLNKVGRKLKIATTDGKPSIKDAPKWAKFIGQTPEGAYHWLSDLTPVEDDKSDKYFPKSRKTEFSGFMGKPSKSGSVEKLSTLTESMKKYTDFDKDFWEKFTKCVADKEWYKLDRKGDKTTIFYDRKEVGVYNHKEDSLTTDNTDYFVLPAKCAK